MGECLLSGVGANGRSRPIADIRTTAATSRFAPQQTVDPVRWCANGCGKLKSVDAIGKAPVVERILDLGCGLRARVPPRKTPVASESEAD